MSAKTDRAERRRAQRDQTELVMQAHDRLHADEVDQAHEILHAILGVGHTPTTGPPLLPGLRFDHEFRDLCVKHNVRAAYVAVEKTSTEGKARLTAGGDSDVCAVVRKALES